VAVDSTGKFAYVANVFDNTVSAYSIAFNGALTPVPGSPFAAGGEPSSVAMDSTGKFAYVANPTSGNVSAYAFLGSSPDAAGLFLPHRFLNNLPLHIVGNRYIQNVQHGRRDILDLQAL
jgi:6-phosphogluconolactonase